MRRLVHLEKHPHRDPADDVARQDDIYIAVAKVERSSQPCRLSAELPDQFIREFAPMSSVPNLANSGRSKGGSGYAAAASAIARRNNRVIDAKSDEADAAAPLPQNFARPRQRRRSG